MDDARRTIVLNRLPPAPRRTVVVRVSNPALAAAVIGALAEDRITDRVIVQDPDPFYLLEVDGDLPARQLEGLVRAIRSTTQEAAPAAPKPRRGRKGNA